MRYFGDFDGVVKLVYLLLSCYCDQVYKKETTCLTCGILKVARSKHCSYSGCCVARVIIMFFLLTVNVINISRKFDFHSVLINNCVGLHNARSYFLWLIFAGLSATKGVLLHIDALRRYVRRMGYLKEYLADVDDNSPFDQVALRLYRMCM